MGVRRVRLAAIGVFLLAACSSGDDGGTASTVPGSATSGSAGPAAADDADGSPTYDLSLFEPLVAVTGPTSRTAARTTLAPLFPAPVGGEPVISADGRKVAYFTVDERFAGDTGEAQIVVGDLLTGEIELVSRGPDGEPGNGGSYRATLSADGRFVAFDSMASNLVANDTNQAPDVFRYDTLSGRLRRISLAEGGRELSQHASYATISGDGRTIVFKARGPDDGQPADFTPDCRDGPNIVVWTAGVGGLECVSLTGEGVPADRIPTASSVSDTPVVNDDGRFVAFQTRAPLDLDDDDGDNDIYVIDRETGLVELVSGGAADGDAESPAISASGRYVAFTSTSPDLVDGDTNGVADVFVYDRLADRTERVSIGASGAEGDGASSRVDISWDGRFVVFDTFATNLTDIAECPIVLRDRALSTSECVAVDTAGRVAAGLTRSASVSADGRLVVFASVDHTLDVGASFERANVYLRWREPPDPVDGWEAPPIERGPAIAPAVTEVLTRDGDGNSGNPVISGDGRWVAFWSDATNLVPGDTNGFRDVFLHDRGSGTTTLVSTAGSPADGPSMSGGSPQLAMSADGRFVVFHSEATNLVPGDTNDERDVFVFDRTTATVTRASVDAGGGQFDNDSENPRLSGDGRFLLFEGRQRNAAPGPEWCGFFLRDMATGGLTCLGLLLDGTSGSVDGPAISADGSTVVFISSYDDVVPGDTNEASDLFGVDVATGVVERLSIAPDGSQADDRSSGQPAVSADGSRIVYVSQASNLVAGDTNGSTDIFLLDRVAGTTTRLNTGPNGEQADSGSGDVAITRDGTAIAYQSRFEDPDRSGTCGLVIRTDAGVECVSVGFDGWYRSGFAPSISDDARFVAFTGSANLAPDTEPGNHVFVRDRGGVPVELPTPEAADVPALPPTMRPPPTLATTTTDAGAVDIPDDEFEGADGVEVVEWDTEFRAALGAVLGPIRLPVADTDREEISFALGPPDAFTVTFDLGDEGAVVRRETWTYLDLLASYEFVDGRYVRWTPVAEPEGYAIPALGHHPLDFERWMTWDIVGLMVDDADAAVEIVVPDDVGQGITGYAAGPLLVFFDAQGLVAAETSIVAGGAP